jgi:branched-chain amino acid transport system substrate-binding protein
MQIQLLKLLPLAAVFTILAACTQQNEPPKPPASSEAPASAPAAPATPAAPASPAETASPAATGASAPTAAATGDAIVVKIGSAEPLTGSIAHLGKDNENGARLAVEDINKEGLVIDGKKIQLELMGEDDEANPKTGTSVAQKLVDAKVVAVVGHLNSGVSIPASKIYNDNGIVQISPASTNPAFTLQGYKTTFRTIATDAQQGPALANFVAKNLGAKTVAVIDDATAYGKGLADQFEATAKAAGLNVLDREATNDKATDFKAILTTLKGKNPDVIMFGGMDAVAGPLAKQANELGIAAKIVGGDGICSQSIIDLAGDGIKNVICSDAAPAISKMAKGPEFEQKYKARYGKDIEYCAPGSYDAVMVIVDAMKRANSTDPAKILAAVPAAQLNGIIGNIAFNDKGDLKEVSITIYDYKDKKKNVLDIVKM